MKQYFDNVTGLVETLLNQTSNSFEMTQKKRTEAGINCTQWFTKSDFDKRFVSIQYA